MSEIKIISANMRGLASKSKRQDTMKYFKEKNVSVLCLQDTHLSPENSKNIYSEWDNECYFSTISSNSRGVAILFNNNIEFKVYKELKTPDGNVIALDVELESKRITLVCLYGPNTDDPNFYENIDGIIESFKNESYVICGDFNLVINPDLDCDNYVRVNNPNARKKVLELIEHRHLIDSYRQFFPDKKAYTWRKSTPLKQSRLDMFLISENLLPSLVSAKIHHSYRSDHSSISINIKLNNFIKGKGTGS